MARSKPDPSLVQDLMPGSRHAGLRSALRTTLWIATGLSGLGLIAVLLSGSLPANLVRWGVMALILGWAVGMLALLVSLGLRISERSASGE